MSEPVRATIYLDPTLHRALRLKAADLPADATASELAAWTLVARVLLNLDETLTKP